MSIITNKYIFFYFLLGVIGQSFQDCPEEYSINGISVKWNKTPSAFNVESEPLCYKAGNLIMRNCSDGKWIPTADDVEPCQKVVKYFDLSSCPPGFNKISENNTDYCYKISAASSWNFPCFTSGGASVITDLTADEMDSLFDSLVASNKSRYFWLPAQRKKVFNPVVWFIPGPNWGQNVKTHNYLKFQNLFWKNCLALDIEQRLVITHSCSEIYPSLCFYLNNINYPASCPEGYHSFRYKPDNGTCFGIEKAEFEVGLTFDDFIATKCKKPMSDSSIDLNRFIFTKLAELNNLPDNAWCWFEIVNETFMGNSVNRSESFEGIINNIGALGLINSSSTLPCMACEAEVIYGETELMFEFNVEEKKIYLTVYFPSGLWKYEYDDKGIQCFSDAKGFVKVVNISDLPFMFLPRNIDENNNYIEKVVYTIDLVTNRSAQYWCEGHTFNFSLISTNKIIVNPKGNEVHVFSMTLNCYNITTDVQNMPDIGNLLSIITEALNVQNILLMDVFEVTNEYITFLLHIHTTVENIYEDEALNILEKYNTLKQTAIENLPKINCTFINLTSSVYCLPTTSNDYITLNWELTPIGHISAPKQFCLQSNGLPVKRQCQGSYHGGGIWGPIEGQCEGNYVPSETTTFLYKIVKGQAPENYTLRFLTDGLGYILSDVDLIIPADIYYLSMSLKQVLNMAQKNETCVDIGDIQNIAWVMDRVMNLDYDYMRLAQTLNSTNVILNSVNDIIEIIANQNVTKMTNIQMYDSTFVPIESVYQVAVEPQYIVQISYPDLSNVTGIAIYKVSPSDKFTDMLIKPLYANTTLDEVLALENLEVATWLPSKLLMSLKLNNNETDQEITQKNLLHIIVSVFKNDIVFQELKAQNHVINSRIVGVSIPGYMPNLKYPLPIVFKQLNQTESKKMCSFWDFQSMNSTQPLGLWKTKGCYPVKTGYLENNFTICECYHLTHFSQLIPIPANSCESSSIQKHTKALNTITLVGCFLSLFGVIGIWITAMVFTNWRRKAGTKVLLQLSTAIALPLIFIVISNIDDKIFVKSNKGYEITENNKMACVILGALLHYSILASFMWMLITAVLQFVRYVRVLGVSRPSRFMFKFALIGWGIPLIPVVVVLSIDLEGYVPSASTQKPMCYPKGYYFILGILLPICIILITNIILFVLVLYSISRSSNEKMKSTDMDLVYAQLRLSIFLFFLLGLTWIFGILSFTTNLIWSYLFCLTATLQGFVLFIYFIVCDPATRNMWIALVKPPFSTNSSRNSITSISQ